MARVIDHTFRRTGAWFGESGRCIYEWSTFRDRQYDHSELSVADGDASILEEPAQGTVGELVLVVGWSYGWFGKVEYTLRAYDAPIPTASQGLTQTLSSRLQEHSGELFGDSGTDHIPFKIPDGFAVREVRISQQAGHAAIDNLNALLGATDSIVVDVSWSYGLFGRAVYFVTVHLVNASLSLSISDETFSPDIGIAGQEVDISYTITNTGTTHIDSVVENIRVYATSLEDFDISGLSDQERTSDLRNEVIPLNLQPGDQMRRNTSFLIPVVASPAFPISSAGSYRVTLSLTVGGVSLAQVVVDSFRVARA